MFVTVCAGLSCVKHVWLYVCDCVCRKKLDQQQEELDHLRTVLDSRDTAEKKNTGTVSLAVKASIGGISEMGST